MQCIELCNGSGSDVALVLGIRALVWLSSTIVVTIFKASFSLALICCLPAWHSCGWWEVCLTFCKTFALLAETVSLSPAQFYATDAKQASNKAMHPDNIPVCIR